MNLSRQFDLVKSQSAFGAIKIIGAGAIGSNTANILARMGFPIHIIDPQNVQNENLAPGMFQKGRTSKVISIKNLLEIQGVDTPIITEQRRATGQDVSPITIISTDDIETRRSIWQNRVITPELYIDARIGKKIITVFAVTKDNIKNYENSLQSEPEELPCGSKATAYTSSIAASWAAAITAQFVQGLPFPHFVYFDVDGEQYFVK